MINAKHTVILFTGLLAFSTASAEMPTATWVATPVTTAMTWVATPVTTAMTWVATPTSAAMTGTISTSVKVWSVDTVDKTTLTVKLDWALTSWVSPQSELKVLKDLNVASSAKNATDWKVLDVTLAEELSLSGANYSLLSLGDLDLNVDFAVNWVGTKVDNTKAWTELAWKTLEVVDAKTLKITFNKDLGTTLPSFKLLKDVKVESVFFDTTNLNVKLSDGLTKDSAYILMVLALKDNLGKDVEVENSLFDFRTPATIVWDEVLASSGALTGSWENLTSSGGTWSDIAAVAMDAKTTPDTWTKENLIILMSLMLATWIFIFRKKSLKI